MCKDDDDCNVIPFLFCDNATNTCICENQFDPIKVCFAVDQSGSICSKSGCDLGSVSSTNPFCCQNYLDSVNFAKDTVDGVENRTTLAQYGFVRFATDSTIETDPDLTNASRREAAR